MWESFPDPRSMPRFTDFHGAVEGLPAVGWSGTPGPNLDYSRFLHSFHSPSTPDSKEDAA